MRLSVVVALLISAWPLLSAHARMKAPWKPREPPTRPKIVHQLRSVETWPAEPSSPTTIDRAKFRDALAYVCREPPDEVPADELLAASSRAGVDPFLLGALMVDRSRCQATKKSKDGYGLLGLHPAFYRSPGAPPVPVNADDAWSVGKLLVPAHNLEVGAQVLRMWQDSHEELDATFGGVEHRSAVAHFTWGDKVRGSGNEDMVFTHRRRLLARYNGKQDAPRPSQYGIPMVPPLEGSPRVATSGPGEDREGGARSHKGLDIVAAEGEPVRSIADGVVIFAGVNMKGNPRKGEIPPSQIARYRHRRLGPGGIYVCVRHQEPRPGHKGVVSCYMHLHSYVTAKDDRVSAGQLLGYVGRTGVRNSPPHLHFELRVDDRHTNPIRPFAELIIPPRATMAYRNALKAMHARRVARANAAKPRDPKMQ